MEIVFAARSDMKPEKWIIALQQALPNAKVCTLDDSSGNADYAVVWAPPAELFKKETRLKAMFNLGAGVDALVKMPDLPANVPLVRLEDGGMANQMAEYVLYFLVQQSRQFLLYAQQQAESTWHHLPSIKRADWRVGIMGAGVIGAKVAQVCATLGYPTAIWSRTAKHIDGVSAYAGPEQFSQFLANTRVLVNVLPLTRATAGILCSNTFKQLLPDAMLINMARGGHLVEADLLQALASGKIKSAVLDVFNTEPLPTEHVFWQHPQITITPHAAGSSIMDATVTQIAAKIALLEQGQEITGIVDKNRQY